MHYYLREGWAAAWVILRITAATLLVSLGTVGRLLAIPMFLWVVVGELRRG